MRNSLLMIALYCCSISLSAQDNCEVKLLEISDNYSGECKKGLAHGEGIATGKDQYNGHFKKGWPQGEGKYVWANGNQYDGEWQTGKQHGEGELIVRRIGVADSIVTGYWKRGQYTGKYAEPYKLGSVRNINRKRIVKRSDYPNQVYFYLKQNGLDKKVSNFVAVNTTGGAFFDQGASQRGISDLKFPTEITVTFVATDSNGNSPTNCEFNIQILEEGTWDITLNL